MKRIINGKRYDTDTARSMGADNYRGSVTDFQWWREELFRKQTGEFFLYGEGGPSTKYAKSVGLNEWTGGERIMPLSYEEARQWAEKHLDAEEYESIFDVAEETKATVGFSLSQQTIDKINKMAAEQKISKSQVIENLLK